MNRIFKVIYNKNKNCYEVVSEFATNHGGKCQNVEVRKNKKRNNVHSIFWQKIVAGFCTTLVLSSLVGTSVQAAPFTEEDKIREQDNVASTTEGSMEILQRLWAASGTPPVTSDGSVTFDGGNHNIYMGPKGNNGYIASIDRVLPRVEWKDSSAYRPNSTIDSLYNNGNLRTVPNTVSRSIVLGDTAVTTYSDSIVMGTKAALLTPYNYDGRRYAPAGTPVNRSSIVIGKEALVRGYGLAIGEKAAVLDSSMYQSPSRGGFSTIGSRDTGTAIGAETFAQTMGTAVGVKSKALTTGDLALGRQAIALRGTASNSTYYNGSVSLGGYTKAIGEGSIAIGSEAKAGLPLSSVVKYYVMENGVQIKKSAWDAAIDTNPETYEKFRNSFHTETVKGDEGAANSIIKITTENGQAYDDFLAKSLASPINDLGGEIAARMSGIGVTEKEQLDAWRLFQNFHSPVHHATAIGSEALAEGSYSISLGAFNKVTGNGSTAIGSGTLDVDEFAKNTNSSEQGRQFNLVSGDNSILIGSRGNIENDRVIAVGNDIHIPRADASSPENNTSGSIFLGDHAGYVGDSHISRDLGMIRVAGEDRETRLTESLSGTKGALKNYTQDFVYIYTLENGENGDRTPLAVRSQFAGGESTVGVVSVGSQYEKNFANEAAVRKHHDDIGSLITLGVEVSSRVVKNGIDLGTSNQLRYFNVLSEEADIDNDKSLTAEDKTRVKQAIRQALANPSQEYTVFETRRIQNVAPGLIGPNSTDVVNGSQLYATNQMLGGLVGSLVKSIGGGATVNENGEIVLGNNQKFSLGWVAKVDKNTAGEAVYSNYEYTAKQRQEDGSETTTTETTDLATNGETIVGERNTFTFIAGKNIALTHGKQSLTIETVDSPKFSGVAVDNGQDGDAAKNLVELGRGKDTTPGATDTEYGKIGLDGKNGTNATITVDHGVPALKDSANHLKDPNAPASNENPTVSDRLTYTTGTTEAPVTHAVATMDDGLRFGANQGDEIAKTLGQKLDIVGGDLVEGQEGRVSRDGTYSGKNIRTVTAADGIAIQMVDRPEFSNVTVSDPEATAEAPRTETVISNTGMTITPTKTDDSGTVTKETDPNKVISLTENGLNNGGKQITNIDSGLTDAEGRPASLANAVSSNAVNVGDLRKATAAASTEVTGTGKAIVTSTTGSNGQTVYNVHVDPVVDVVGADGTPVVRGDDGKYYAPNEIADKTFVPNPDGNGGTWYNAGDVVNGAPTPEAQPQTVRPADIKTSLVNPNADTNTPNADNSVVLDNVKSGIGGDVGNGATKGVIVGDKEEGTNTFLDNLRKVGTEEGPNPNTVATTGDLKKLSESPLFFSGDMASSDDVNNTFGRTLSDEVKIVGGASDATKLTDNNIGVVSNGTDTLTIKLAKNISDLESVAVSNGKDGDAAKNLVELGRGKDTTPGATDTEYGKIGLDGKNGTNATITVDRGAATLVDTANHLTNPEAPASDENPTVSDRLTYTTGTPEAPVNHTVATMDDGLRFGANQGDEIAKTLGTKLNIVGGDVVEGQEGRVSRDGNYSGKNIRTVTAADGIAIQMVDRPEFSNVTVSDPEATAEAPRTETVISNTGMTITPTKTDENGAVTKETDQNKVISLTENGLNNGGKQITNLGSGLTNAEGQPTSLANAVDTNAVNVGDLKAAAAAATTEVTGTGKAIVTSTTGSNGQTVYNVHVDPVVDVVGADGTPVVRGDDGKYYAPNEIADKTFVPNPDGNGGTWYNAGDVVNGAPTPEAQPQTVRPADIKTSLVNPNADTNTPNADNSVVLDNVKSGIGGEVGNGATKGVTVGDKEEGTNTFLDNLRKVGTKEGPNPNTVATTGDLKKLSESPLFFSGDMASSNDVNNTFGRTLSDEVKIVGGASDATKLTDNNIGVVSNGTDTLTIKLAKNISDLESVAVSNGKDGDAAKNLVELGRGKDTTPGATDTEYGTIGLDGKNGTNATITVDRGAATLVDTANHLTNPDAPEGDDNPPVSDRLTYTTGTPEAPVNHTVATMDDGLRFGANQGDEIAKTLGTKLNIVGGDVVEGQEGRVSRDGTYSGKNIRTVTAADGIAIQMVDRPEFSNVTVSDPAATPEAPRTETVISNTGMTITPTKTDENGAVTKETDPNKVISLTENGLNNGGKQITNLGSGLTNAEGQPTSLANAVDTNAVNVGDLKAAAAAATTEVTGTGKAIVTSTTGSAGQHIYNVHVDPVVDVVGADGTPVVRGDDGKYYAPNEIADKTFVPNPDGDGGTWYNASDVVNGAPTPEAQPQTVRPADIKTSLVNPNADTNTPNADNSVVLDNVKSGIGGEVGNGATKGVTVGDKEVGTNTFLDNLRKVGTEEGTNPNTVATTGDLKKLSESPLFFSGDTASSTEGKNTFGRTLSDEIKIVGGTNDATKLTDNNIGVVSNGTNTLTVKLAKDIGGLRSITAVGDNGNLTRVTGEGIVIQGNNNSAPVSVTANGLDNGGNRITNVAEGIEPSDAVSVSQLRNMESGLRQDIGDVGADAAALAGLKPIQYDPLEPTQIMAAIGSYRGKKALALGLAHYKNEETMFHMGVTLGSRHTMANIGVTYKFGDNDKEKRTIQDRYKAGPISSTYILQDEVVNLQKENVHMKLQAEYMNEAYTKIMETLQKLQEDNEAMKKELAELRANKV